MMKRCFGFVVLMLAVASFSFGQTASKTDLSKLVGTWKVDLRPTPDAAEYFQEFVITKFDGKTFTGTFYGAPIKGGVVNTDWETVYLAFTSEDGSGLYAHFATLEGNKLKGATNSTGRGFLMPWRAEKKAETPKTVTSK